MRIFNSLTTMQDDIGLNRQISIMLILNALTGFIYTSLPNTYIVKQQAYELCLLLMAACAALISYAVWLYGKHHAQKQAKQILKYQANITTEGAWEQTVKWLLPAFFIPLFAFVGTRALIVLWGYHGTAHYAEAVIMAQAAPNQGNWWQLQFHQPFKQELTLAADAHILANFAQGDRVRIEFRETPIALNFTSLHRYWQVEKITTD